MPADVSNGCSGRWREAINSLRGLTLRQHMALCRMASSCHPIRIILWSEQRRNEERDRG
jgi:hypothetical protein